MHLKILVYGMKNMKIIDLTTLKWKSQDKSQVIVFEINMAKTIFSNHYVGSLGSTELIQ